ncbi:UPF0690 protein C1orf52 homolog [Striga asiatica]|uniref:UPF0690 protein C1orf52 homolog n=1 Tax=Striga asiatica TaxID=4170 RepID=A0A5A7PMI4_STRAF|nr:UPF0690 protein C1orf52 homolog [Striga asiatica]
MNIYADNIYLLCAPSTPLPSPPLASRRTHHCLASPRRHHLWPPDPPNHPVTSPHHSDALSSRHRPPPPRLETHIHVGPACHHPGRPLNLSGAPSLPRHPSTLDSTSARDPFTSPVPLLPSRKIEIGNIQFIPSGSSHHRQD